MINRRNVLKYWVAPVVLTVSLPSHAQTSCCDGVSRPIDVSASNQSCDSASSPNVASFTLCNNELDSVSVFLVEDSNVVNTLSITPALPFSIPIGGCIDVQLSLSVCPVNTGIGFEARLENSAVVGGFSVPYA
jgi:hypothetical protein